jgi:glycosyltransferase involved in cell wall biosynthesis
MMSSDTNVPASDENDVTVSVVIPALNEEQTIGPCIQAIKRAFREHDLKGEIIVADSSTDRTPDIARSMGAIVVHPEERGYGNAYLTGFRYARGEYIVMGDADNTYDFSNLSGLIDPLRKNADLVIGSRFSGEIQPGAMTWLHQYIGNPFLTWLLNRVCHTNFTDAHSGFRAIRRDALERLNLTSPGMEFALEMLVAATRAHLRVTEVPNHYAPRQTPSKLHSFADGWRHVRFILLLEPIPFFAVPGLIFAIIGFILIGLLAMGTVELHTHSIILGGFLLVGGTQALLTGALVNVYSVIHGYGERGRITEKILEYHNLERLLLLGGVLIAVGTIIGAFIITEWIQSGYGSLSQIANAIISLSSISIGIQIIFFAIFVSMMRMNLPES